jgi:hypothetical protein
MDPLIASYSSTPFGVPHVPLNFCTHFMGKGNIIQTIKIEIMEYIALCWK